MDSQDKTVLTWLLSGKTISSLECTLKWRHTRLGRSISTLRHLGWNILDKWEGEGQSKYKRYYIPADKLKI